jgi:hypothetical protein
LQGQEQRKLRQLFSLQKNGRQMAKHFACSMEAPMARPMEGLKARQMATHLARPMEAPMARPMVIRLAYPMELLIVMVIHLARPMEA